MPYDVHVMGKRDDIIKWLDMNVGKFTSNTHYWAAKGVGWEMLPFGMTDASIFVEPKKYVIRLWDKDNAFLTRLRWE